MPEKVLKVLKLLNDYLWYNEEKDNIVVIPEEEFIKNGLTIENVKIIFYKLFDESIIEDYQIRDRFYNACPVNYEEKKEYIKQNVPLSGIFSKDTLGTPLYFIEIKNKEKIIELLKEKEKISESQTDKKVSFDGLSGVLFCGQDQYKIQSELKLILMKKLWEERKEIKIDQNNKEKIIRKGII